MESVPKIGLTTLFKENPGVAGDWYVRPHKYDLSIAEAGGLPVSIPAFAGDKLLEQYMEMLDGILFIGGPDIPPHLYGGEPPPCSCKAEPRAGQCRPVPDSLCVRRTTEPSRDNSRPA